MHFRPEARVYSIVKILTDELVRTMSQEEGLRRQTTESAEITEDTEGHAGNSFPCFSL